MTIYSADANVASGDSSSPMGLRNNAGCVYQMGESLLPPEHAKVRVRDRQVYLDRDLYAALSAGDLGELTIALRFSYLYLERHNQEGFGHEAERVLDICGRVLFSNEAYSSIAKTQEPEGSVWQVMRVPSRVQGAWNIMHGRNISNERQKTISQRYLFYLLFRRHRSVLEPILNKQPHLTSLLDHLSVGYTYSDFLGQYGLPTGDLNSGDSDMVRLAKVRLEQAKWFHHRLLTGANKKHSLEKVLDEPVIVNWIISGRDWSGQVLTVEEYDRQLNFICDNHPSKFNDISWFRNICNLIDAASVTRRLRTPVNFRGNLPPSLLYILSSKYIYNVPANKFYEEVGALTSYSASHIKSSIETWQKVYIKHATTKSQTSRFKYRRL